LSSGRVFQQSDGFWILQGLISNLIGWIHSSPEIFYVGSIYLSTDGPIAKNPAPAAVAPFLAQNYQVQLKQKQLPRSNL
jgi:hypothetical protein